MPVVDLGAQPEHGAAGRAGAGTVDVPEFRVALTQPELEFVADLLGVGLPSVFAPARSEGETAAGAVSALEARLGDPTTGVTGGSDEVWRSTLAGLPDAEQGLITRGLISADTNATQHGSSDGGDDSALVALGDPPEVAGFVVAPPLVRLLGILVNAEVAVGMELALATRSGSVQAQIYHSVDGDAVAVLSSLSGVIWEAGLLPLSSWPHELARVVTTSDTTSGWGEDDSVGRGEVLWPVELPFVLTTVGCDFIETHRTELLGPLVEQHSGQTTRNGDPLSDDVVAAVLDRISNPSGRLRAMVARPKTASSDIDSANGAREPDHTIERDTAKADSRPDCRPAVGVLSWVLTDHGWMSLSPRGNTEDPRVLVAPETPDGLSPALSRLIAQVLP